MSNKEIQTIFALDENFTVTQHNQLITSKHEMGALEQKLILILISTIKKEDTKLLIRKFRVKDLANLMQVSEELLYRDLDKICEKLLSRVVTIKNSENKKDWNKFNIVSTAKYNDGEGSINLRLNDDAGEFLLQLKELFLAYKLKEILYLNSKYSIRLYQLTKSNSYKKRFTIDLDKFKDMMALEQKSYNQFSNINLKVLTPAIDEINKKTDVNIKCKPLKTGRRVTGLDFTIIDSKKTQLTKSNSYGNYTGNNSKRLKNSDYKPKQENFTDDDLFSWYRDKDEAAITIDD